MIDGKSFINQCKKVETELLFLDLLWRTNHHFFFGHHLQCLTWLWRWRWHRSADGYIKEREKKTTHRTIQPYLVLNLMNTKRYFSSSNYMAKMWQRRRREKAVVDQHQQLKKVFRGVLTVTCVDNCHYSKSGWGNWKSLVSRRVAWRTAVVFQPPKTLVCFINIKKRRPPDKDQVKPDGCAVEKTSVLLCSMLCCWGRKKNIAALLSSG